MREAVIAPPSSARRAPSMTMISPAGTAASAITWAPAPRAISRRRAPPSASAGPVFGTGWSATIATSRIRSSAGDASGASEAPGTAGVSGASGGRSVPIPLRATRIRARVASSGATPSSASGVRLRVA